MSKIIYKNPMFLVGNGTITMTVSQMGALGLDSSTWNDFWDSAGDYCVYENFDINNPGTYPEGFDPGDDTTWDILTDELP